MRVPDEIAGEAAPDHGSCEDLDRIIRRLVDGQPYGVLCTQGRGQPYGSLVAYAMTPDLGSAPGTHSKWARVENGRIVGFRTHMSEVFAVLKAHSIIGRLMAEGPENEGAFADGLARAGDDGGLLHHLFGARTRGLFDELPAASLASYLSGMLIGHELAAETKTASTVHVLGAPRLSALYGRALERSGRQVRRLDPDAAVAGLFALARKLPRKNV